MQSEPVGAWESWNAIAVVELDDLDTTLRPLYALGWLRTEINNGGFSQLFFNSAGDLVPDAVAAARSAGAHDLAHLVEEAMSLLGSGYVVDRSLRQDRLLALTDVDELRLSQLNDRYFELEVSTDLDAVMAQLVTGP